MTVEVPWKCLDTALIDSEHNQGQCCLKNSLTATSISVCMSPTFCSVLLSADHFRLPLGNGVCCVPREIDCLAGCLLHTLTHSARSLTHSLSHSDSYFRRTGRDVWGDNHLTFAADNCWPTSFPSKFTKGRKSHDQPMLCIHLEARLAEAAPMHSLSRYFCLLPFLHFQTRSFGRAGARRL